MYGVNDSLQTHPWLMRGLGIKNQNYGIVQKNPKKTINLLEIRTTASSE